MKPPIPPDALRPHLLASVSEWMGRKIRDKMSDTTNILPSRMSRDELVDYASNMGAPMGTIRKAVLAPVEMSVRGILDMPADRMAALGKSQFAKLRNALPGDLSTAPVDDFEALSAARSRLFEEAQRRSGRDANLRLADKLNPSEFFESPASAADIARSNGPRSGAWAKKYR